MSELSTTLFIPLILLIVSGMGTVAWYFVKRIIHKLDYHNDEQAKLAKANKDLLADFKVFRAELRGDLSAIPKLANAVRDINGRMAHFEKQLEIAMVAAGQVKAMVDEVAVLKRNQATQWLRIDELRVENEAMRGVIEGLNGMISDFRAHVESINEPEKKRGH